VLECPTKSGAPHNAGSFRKVIENMVGPELAVDTSEYPDASTSLAPWRLGLVCGRSERSHFTGRSLPRTNPKGGENCFGSNDLQRIAGARRTICSIALLTALFRPVKG
jgi:hypothetical protein